MGVESCIGLTYCLVNMLAWVLSIVGLVIAVIALAYKVVRNQQQAKERLQRNFGENAVMVDRLLQDMRGYVDRHDCADEHFMQGLTFDQSMQVLEKYKTMFAEEKKKLDTPASQLNPNAMDNLNEKLTDNLGHWGHVRNRMDLLLEEEKRRE